ncbi:MAG: GlcG/HbpS family heme-binding protein [Candidatus Woesearchaeota archaeon]
MTTNKNKNYHEIPNISVEKALEIIRYALDISSKLNVRASISIVDRSMNLIAFAKADGATPHSTGTSRKKANTSASTGKATGWMSQDLAITLPLATDNKLTNIVGGLPLIFDGKLVGGLGIAGGTVVQDEEIAKKIIQEIGSDISLKN